MIPYDQSKPSVADFFAQHAPLQSFSAMEPTEYIEKLRQNSRILLFGDEVVESL